MNVKKKIIIEQLADYFIDKGKILTYSEYKKQDDAPIRHVLIPRLVGPWPRIEPLIARAFPEKYAIIKAGGIVSEDLVAKKLAEEEAKAAALAKLRKEASNETDKE